MNNWTALEKTNGKYNISLQLLSTEHIKDLTSLASDKQIWNFHADRFENPDIFQEKWVNSAFKQIKNNQRICIVIYLDNKIIGSSSYYDIHESNKTLAVGYTWFHPDYWGMKLNQTVKLIMLEHAFEKLHFNRVSFFVDSINSPSINSLKKWGAQYEGTLRNHMILSDGRIRHTVVLSVIKEEWARVKLSLQERVG